LRSVSNSFWSYGSSLFYYGTIDTSPAKTMSHDAAHANAPPSAPQAPASPPTNESIANDDENRLKAAHDDGAIDQRSSGGTGSTADGTAQGQIAVAAQRHSGASGTLHAAQKSPASAFNVAAAPVLPASASGETELETFFKWLRGKIKSKFASRLGSLLDTLLREWEFDEVQELKNAQIDNGINSNGNSASRRGSGARS
jgi:hypothetical protein